MVRREELPPVLWVLRKPPLLLLRSLLPLLRRRPTPRERPRKLTLVAPIHSGL